MSGNTLKTGFFVLLLACDGWYIFEQEKQEFRLNEAPVVLGTVQERLPPKAKASSYHVRLRLLASPAPNPVVMVAVEQRLFDQLRLTDTLAVRHLPGTSEAALLPAAPPSAWRWLLGAGLLYIGLFLYSYGFFPDLEVLPLYLHTALTLVGGGMLVWGFRGCTSWAALNQPLELYKQGTHITGRVLAIGPPDSAAAVLVAYRPIEELPPFVPRHRWLPVPPVYRYTFGQALRLQWRPVVEVWYPEHEQENAQLLVQLQPAATDADGRGNGLLVVAGLVVLFFQIKPLEAALRNRSESCTTD